MALLESLISKADICSAYPEMYPEVYATDIADSVEVGGVVVTVGPGDEADKELRKIFTKKKYDDAKITSLMSIADQMTKSTDTFKYASYNDFALELEMRYNVIQTMRFVEMNPNTFGYNYYQHIDKFHWEPLSRTEIFPTNYMDEVGSEEPKFRYRQTKDNTPVKAVNAIFAPTDRQKVTLDCNAMMTAIQYKAMVDTFGEKFNKMFPNGKGLVIGPVAMPGSQDTYPEYGAESKTGTKEHPFVDLKLYDVTVYAYNTFKYVAPDKREKPPENTPVVPKLPVELEAILLPGDWVYFQNHDDYITQTPQGGNWSGEHAVYLGNGKFTGFGLGLGKDPVYPGYTYYEMLEFMQYEYDNAYAKNAMNHKKTDKPKTISEMPGITARFRPNMKTITDTKK